MLFSMLPAQDMVHTDTAPITLGARQSCVARSTLAVVTSKYSAQQSSNLRRAQVALSSREVLLQSWCQRSASHCCTGACFCPRLACALSMLLRARFCHAIVVPAQRVALLHSCVSSPAQTGTFFGTHPRHPCMCLFVRMGALCPSMRMRLPPLQNCVILRVSPTLSVPAGRLASG